jgi:biotin transporter BioY
MQRILLLSGAAARAALVALLPVLLLDVVKMAVVAALAPPLRAALSEVEA